MDVILSESWKRLLKPEMEREYFKELIFFLKNEYKTNVVYPPQKDVFRLSTIARMKM